MASVAVANHSGLPDDRNRWIYPLGGGSIGTDSAGWETALLVFYLAGTALGDGAFLDLALRYARPAQSRIPTIAFYALAIITAIAIPISPFLPTNILEQRLGLCIGLAFLMSIAGGVVFLVTWFRATNEVRREYKLTPIAIVLIVTSALGLLGEQGVLPGDAAAWTLPYGLVPIVFAWAMTRRGDGHFQSDTG